MQFDLFTDLEDSTIDPDGRTCLWCKKKKHISNFSKHSHFKDNYDTRCKQCIKEAGKITKQLREDNMHLKTNVCDCCGKEPRGYRGLVLDHCHDTLKFRGWLCELCNLGIGQLGDNLEGVEKALAYLRRHYDGQP